jgi:hypothetical protein
MAYRNYSAAVSHIVDATGQGDFTTLGAALTALAGAGTNNTTPTIFMRPGTYTENDTISTACNIVAFPGDGLQGNVIIKGNMTISSAITVSFSGVELQTNSAAFLTVSGSAASIVNLINCYLNCTNNTGISYSSSSSSSQINIYNCQGNLGTTGIGYFSASSAGTMNIYYCFFQNTGASTTASTTSATGINIGFTNIFSPLSTSSTGAIGANNATIQSGSQNATALTLAGTGSSTAIQCYFTTGTASGISIGAGTTLFLTNSVINSSNTNAITGAGTIEYQGISFTNSSSTINTTTQTVSGTLIGSRNTAPSAGFLGEQIRSYVSSPVSLVTGTAKTVASIVLTAGVWDISGLLSFTLGATTIPTLFQLSLSPTNNTSQNNFGDSDSSLNLQTGASLGTGYQPTLTVPSYRVVTTGETFYLVATCTFTVSTAVAVGRISATRVG